MAAHGTRKHIARLGLFLLRRIVWGVPGTPIGDLLPTLLTALGHHRDTAEVAVHGVACLRILAHADGTEVGGALGPVYVCPVCMCVFVWVVWV